MRATRSCWKVKLEGVSDALGESRAEMENREVKFKCGVKFRTIPKIREKCGTHRTKTFTPAMPKGPPPARIEGRLTS